MVGDRRWTMIVTGTLSMCVVVFSACSDNDSDPADVGIGDPAFSHAEHFAANPYVGPNMNTACIGCHAEQVQEILATGHFNWSGVTANVVGVEGEVHGKQDYINNFCIGVSSNEQRCSQCHLGTGYDDKSYDFGDPAGVDCLVCHDTTGTYAKDPMTAGRPVGGLDWDAIAAGIGMPGRENCGACHYFAGGGDNVKHGDLAASLNDTTREYDVHMGVDGGDFRCTTCHGVDDAHGIGGMPFHSVDEGDMRSCADCHSEQPHAEGSRGHQISTDHPTLACQVCHIPTFARQRTTKVEWYWETAGDPNRVPVDVGDGRKDYDKKKGDFVWQSGVRPVLRRHDGSWRRMMQGVNDTYEGSPSPNDPVVLAEPAAPRDPAAAGGTKIYPFKRMVGTQVADVGNRRIMVPHLFGKGTGPNPYWGRFDWDLALVDAAAYQGIPYSGDFGFVDTVMYLTINHEVAPKEMALGNGGCMDCHGRDASGRPRIDWDELGREGPMLGDF